MSKKTAVGGTAILKEINVKKIFELISQSEGISRAEIAAQLGLSVPTVAKAAKALVSAGFLTERANSVANMGRTPALLYVNGDNAFTVGVEFEGGLLSMGIVNLAHKLIHKRTIRVTPDLDMVIHNIFLSEVRRLIAESGINPENIIGIGIGLPGVVDSKKNELRRVSLVGADDNVNLKPIIDYVEEQLKTPVYVINDANAAALGEFEYRDKADGDLIYISVGTGVGAGIILNNTLRTGHTGHCGEIGYMFFEMGGRSSAELPGWLERKVNVDSILEMIKERRSQGNHDVEDVYAYVADLIAVAIANIEMILDVDLVVIGGTVVNMLGTRLLDKVREKFDERCVIKATISHGMCEEPAIMGAARVAYDNRIDALLKAICV